jgi:hypothetical protein
MLNNITQGYLKYLDYIAVYSDYIAVFLEFFLPHRLRRRSGKLFLLLFRGLDLYFSVEGLSFIVAWRACPLSTHRGLVFGN